MLADAWRPPALEMRDALSGELITRIPLGERFIERFGQPYAVTHRADIHARVPQGLPGQQPGHAGEQPQGRGLRRARRRRHRHAAGRRADRRPRADRLRRHVVEDPRAASSATARRACPATSPIAAVLKREEVPDDLWRPDVVLWAGPRTHFVHYPLRRGELYNLVAVFHSDRYVEGWNAEGDPDVLWAALQGPAARGPAHAGAHRDLAHVGAVRPRAGEGLVAAAASRCSAMPPTRCCNIWRRAPAWRPRTRSALAEKVAAQPARHARPPSRPMSSSAICAPRGCRSWRASTANSITPRGRHRRAARPDARRPHRRAGL